jgi:YidC/Oxa1 family membrane protein insertase
LGEEHYSIGFKDLAVTRISANSSGELKTQIFAGSKEHARLVKLPEGMELTVDFGILTILSAPLFWLLVKIHGMVANWGVAIILLTVLIKLAFFPLSAASYRSMAHMRRVQPKIQSIKDRFGKDKAKLNTAMMDIYKKEKINPLGGCLPILIQIPVFISLYWVLLESVEMRQAPFALWIQDLSAPDPFFVLPIIMGISMYIQHWLNPAVMDPVQKKIMLIMPGMFQAWFFTGW